MRGSFISLLAGATTTAVGGTEEDCTLVLVNVVSAVEAAKFNDAEWSNATLLLSSVLLVALAAPGTGAELVLDICAVELLMASASSTSSSSSVPKSTTSFHVGDGASW